MATPSPIEELNSCKHLYLEQACEPEVNGLRLVLSEGIVSSHAETLVVGDVELPNVRPIEVTPDSRWFEVVWDSYIAYAVRNESYCNWDEGEAFPGDGVIQLYSASKFLEFVANGTIASSDYPGPFVHYQIVCSDHVVDVASEHPPTVRRWLPNE